MLPAPPEVIADNLAPDSYSMEMSFLITSMFYLAVILFWTPTLIYLILGQAVYWFPNTTTTVATKIKHPD